MGYLFRVEVGGVSFGVGESVSVCVLMSCGSGVCIGCEAGVCAALGVAVLFLLRLLSERVLCRFVLSLGAVILGRGFLGFLVACLVVGIMCRCEECHTYNKACSVCMVYVQYYYLPLVCVQYSYLPFCCINMYPN